MLSPHQPRILSGPNRTWVVECEQCRRDREAMLPIGIGMPLQDQETAQRLVENHIRSVLAR